MECEFIDCGKHINNSDKLLVGMSPYAVSFDRDAFLGPMILQCYLTSLCVAKSGLGVILCAPIPLGRNTTHKSRHVHWSEVKIFDMTKSKLL